MIEYSAGLLSRVLDNLSRFTGIPMNGNLSPYVADKIRRVLNRYPQTDRFLSTPDNPIWLTSPLYREILHEVLTGESYFFRSPAQGDLLFEEILPVLAASDRHPATIWSAGCSTGEEPYTLSIMIKRMDPLANIKTFRILASDINPKALEIARGGGTVIGPCEL